MSKMKINPRYEDYISLNFVCRDRLYNSMKEFLECPVCSKLIINPMMCSVCQNSVCSKCLDDWHNRNNTDCIFRCNNPIFSRNRMIDNTISKLFFNCKNGCGAKFTIDQLESHVKKCPGKKSATTRIINTDDLYNANERIPSKKVILLGDASVGKTSLLESFQKGKLGDVRVTVIVNFVAINYLLSDGSVLNFQIWDTAGQEKFAEMNKLYIKDSAGCFLVYDMTRENTFNRCKKLYKDFKEEMNSNEPVILVGNKSDLVEDKKVSTEAAIDFAKQNNLLFMETSAMSNNNVINAFEALFEMINFEHKKGYTTTGEEVNKFSLEDDKNKKSKCCK